MLHLETEGLFISDNKNSTGFEGTRQALVGPIQRNAQ